MSTWNSRTPDGKRRRDLEQRRRMSGHPTRGMLAPGGNTVTQGKSHGDAPPTPSLRAAKRCYADSAGATQGPLTRVDTAAFRQQDGLPGVAACGRSGNAAGARDVRVQAPRDTVSPRCGRLGSGRPRGISVSAVLRLSKRPS